MHFIQAVVQHHKHSPRQVKDLISAVFYSIRTSSAEVLWLLCEQNLYHPWQSQFPDNASTSRHSQSFWWIPTDYLPPCVRIDSNAKCWTRPPSKHANWTLFRRRYWLNSLMTFSRLLLQLLMTLFWQAAFLLCSGPPLSGRCLKKKKKKKKSSLDTDNVNNYKPVSTLPFLSKITEQIVLLQLSQHLESNNLLYPLQSVYRLGHSTETALLKSVNDLLAALDVNHISLLSLLDLSAAFDTIDHPILLSRLHHTFSISGTALSWFQSHFADRTQVVSVNDASSAPAALNFGVPRG